MNSGLTREENTLRLKAEKQMGILRSSSTFRANKYEVIRGIWKGVVVPMTLHGIETLHVRVKDSHSLETIQNKAARLRLGANKYNPSGTLRDEM